MSQPSVNLTRAKIKRILKRKPGSMAEIARGFGVTRAAVSGVLRGKSDSARVLAAAEAKAREILASEEVPLEERQ